VQIQTVNLRDSDLTKGVSVSVDYEYGNAFVVAEDIHEQRSIVHISRDANEILGIADLGTA
jgi:hypothetical protein